MTIVNEKSRAYILAELGQPEQALSVLGDKFTVAQNYGPQEVLNTLENQASFIASIDNGQTLWEIYSAIAEVDSWWRGQ